MPFKESELAIIFTLAYTDQFDFPLTETELWQRLISLSSHSISRPDFKKALLKLALQKVIVYQGVYLCLADRTEIIAKRKARAVIAQQKQSEIEQLKKILKHVPSIDAAFVTGSVAMQNADADDDLDLLIVTAPHRVWLTRLILLSLTWFLGKKKTRADEGKHGWCLNLWLDEQHLAVEESKQDLYQAYEVVQAVPIYGKPAVIAEFYQVNEWSTTFLPNLDKTFEVGESEGSSDQLNTQFSEFKKRFFDWLETVAYSMQLRYMNSHRTTEKVGPGFAFFHPRPTGKLVKEGWLHSLQQLKNSAELDTIAATYADTLFANSSQKPSRSR